MMAQIRPHRLTTRPGSPLSLPTCSKPAYPSESPAPGRCNPMGFHHLQEHRLLSCCRSQWQLHRPSLWAWEWGKNAYYTVHSPYYTVHSINSNKTDPDSFDSNVHAIIWAIFENEALVRRLHECPIFAKTLQLSVGWRKQQWHSTRFPMWHIISYSVWFRPFTWSSWNIHRMEVQRASFQCLASRGNLWRVIKFWQPWKSNIYSLFLFQSSIRPFFTIWLLNTVNRRGIFWDCQQEAKFWPSWWQQRKINISRICKSWPEE